MANVTKALSTSEQGFSGQACASLHCDTWDSPVGAPGTAWAFSSVFSGRCGTIAELEESQQVCCRGAAGLASPDVAFSWGPRLTL